ncbi:diguanylate cyclase [Vibrio sp.]|uniref:diguanylate cyclase n=1 Tax=Vibrio sp. TaxID=678 RepID=UPI003D149CF1
MTYTSGKHKFVTWVFISFIVLSVGLLESVHHKQEQYIREDLEQRVREELSIVRSSLESTILADIYVAYSIATVLPLDPDTSMQQWDQVAANVLERSKHIRNIALAPNDVVRYVYPLNGNEQLLGSDYRQYPEQWQAVVKARENREIFVAGPVNLIQGGRGLVIRIPLFSDPPYNRHYWGVYSFVLDLDSLLSATGIETFKYKYQIAMRGRDSSGGQGEVFYGTNAVFEQAIATESVRFPYGSWSIAAATRNDLLRQAPWYQVQLTRLVGYPLLIILTVAFVVIYNQYRSAESRALHDDLTGLPNRRYFMFTLEQQFKSFKRGSSRDVFAVMSIDVDKFKAVNDSYGHAAGDKVLLACAERIKSALRSSDLVARIGGDEFLVLLPRVTSAHDVHVINIELHKSICRTPVIYEQHLIDLSVSIGHAICDVDVNTVDDLLKLADSEMYLEKRRQHAL